MTYGRVRFAATNQDLVGAAVSHLAELVRGELKAPSSGPSGQLLPKGRRATVASPETS
jgi:hypothetical protein